MQVVSGPIGRQRVHFEAPPADRLETETRRFLDWINGESGEPPLIKAGLAHLWFVTLHPFDDGNGRIASVTSFERVDPTGQTLGNANSVASRQYKWHDSQGRLTAVADLGTGSRHESAPSGMSGAYANYMNGTDPVFVSRPTRSPYAEYNSSSGLFVSVDRQGLPAWVKITCFEYDEQGRESVVINPAGSVTRKYYNAFGELTRQVDNADETATINDARRRVTLYKYDLGRLINPAICDRSAASILLRTSRVSLASIPSSSSTL